MFYPIFWLSVHPDQDQHCSSRQFFCTPPAAHECLLSALVSWALLDFSNQFRPLDDELLESGGGLPTSQSTSSCMLLRTQQKLQPFLLEESMVSLFLFFLVSLLDCIKRTEMDLFQQDWRICSNWFIPNKSLIGLPNPSKTLPIILLCE